MNIPEHLIPILTMIEPTMDWEKMTIEEWVRQVFDGNEATIAYLPMELLNGDQIDRTLRRFPKKANDGKIKWKKLNGNDWSTLLQYQPQFSVHCDDWDKLSDYDWSYLLQSQPQLAIYKKQSA